VHQVGAVREQCRFRFEDEDTLLINNRQQGRRRGRGNGPQRPGGGGQGQRDSGNRIDSRARGNAAQLLEKYKNMARDAQMSGDRVNTEYYLQFADHYFRVLADQRGRNEEQGQQRRQQRDDFDQFDPFDDFGDEGEPVRADEMQRAQEGDRQGGERQQSDRQQNDRQYGDRQYGDRSARDDRQRDNRDERPRYDRDERQRDGRDGREDRQQRQPREDRPRFDRDRRPVEARDDERRFQRPTQAPVANDVDTPPADLPAANAVASQDHAPVNDAQAEEAPRRRTRTRKPRDEAADTGVQVEALGADRLPPALGLVRQEGADAPTSAVDDIAAEAPKPRRRRIARAASGEATPAE
jgi:hypothetical protein